MDINVNTSKLKDTRDEETSVTYISLIKAKSYFKLFECGKELLNNLDTTYERAFMANVKYKSWTEMYNTITN